MSAAISLKPLAAALLLCAAASAQATIDATDVSLHCSDALSINDVDGLVVRCSGDLRVSGAGPDSVLRGARSVTLQAASDLRLDDLHIVSPRIVLDAPRVSLGNQARLDASHHPTGSDRGSIVLRTGGDLRLGAGLDPNRVNVTVEPGGSVVMAVNFSGVVFGSMFQPGGNLSVASGFVGGSVSGVRFNAGTNVTGAALSAPSRYIAPFLLAQASTASLSPVPEPTTWALLLGGISALGFLRRRRA